MIDRDADEQDLATVRSILAELTNASVLTVGGTDVRDGSLFASSFQVKVASPKNLNPRPPRWTSWWRRWSPSSATSWT